MGREPTSAPLIDHFLPVFQFRERHALTVCSRPMALLDAVSLDEAVEDPWTRTFLTMRELPDRLLTALGINHKEHQRVVFGIDKFMRLGRDSDREVVLGLAGRFWRPDYGLVTVEQPETFFPNYTEPGLAKLVLNFATEPLPDGRTRLTTETRVFCVDAQAMTRFKPYWMLIRPVSGLIRRRLLARIDRVAAGL